MKERNKKIDNDHSLTLTVRGKNVRTIYLNETTALLIYNRMLSVAGLLSEGKTVKIRITGE